MGLMSESVVNRNMHVSDLLSVSVECCRIFQTYCQYELFCRYLWYMGRYIRRAVGTCDILARYMWLAFGVCGIQVDTSDFIKHNKTNEKEQLNLSVSVAYRQIYVTFCRYLWHTGRYTWLAVGIYGIQADILDLLSVSMAYRQIDIRDLLSVSVAYRQIYVICCRCLAYRQIDIRDLLSVSVAYRQVDIRNLLSVGVCGIQADRYTWLAVGIYGIQADTHDLPSVSVICRQAGNRRDLEVMFSSDVHFCKLQVIFSLMLLC
jgi:hypothetical protein